MHCGFPHLSVARQEHRSLPPTVQLRWAFQAGSRRLRASILIIRTSWRHRSVGCSRVCLPSGANLEGSRLRQLEKHLTRRANHRHIIIIAKIVQSPGGEIRRGLFVWKIPIGRRPHVTTPHLPTPVAWGVAGVSPSELSRSSLAGTRERAGARRGAEATAASGPCSRDTVRARNDRSERSCRTFIFQRKADDRVSDIVGVTTVPRLRVDKVLVLFY